MSAVVSLIIGRELILIHIFVFCKIEILEIKIVWMVCKHAYISALLHNFQACYGTAYKTPCNIQSKLIMITGIFNN